MAKLLGIQIRNYRALSDVRVGQVTYAQGDALPGLACFIGPNGSGKSTLLDAFGFIADCLLEGVEAACDKPARGGFDRLRTQGSSESIEFTLFFDEGDPQRPIVYELKIDLVDGIPGVVAESLRQRRPSETKGRPYYFLKLKNGKGKAWAGEDASEGGGDKSVNVVDLADRNRLGITTLGNLSEHPRIVRLREYIEQWYLSYFVPDAARALPPAGPQKSLDRTGANIGNVLQYFEREYRAGFDEILRRVSRSIPGLNKIGVEQSADKRLLLKFSEAGYVDPFYQQSMSDGTLKMLAYAVLLADPHPRQFIGIEEPENGLYVQLVESLAGLFAGKADSTQILVTTHSPYFVDALQPEQVWLIRKDALGHAQVKRAADVPQVKGLIAQGLPLGSLWYSNHLDEEEGA